MPGRELTGVHVLIVDDNVAIAAGLQRILTELCGARVSTATDCAGAILLLEQDPVDLAVLDRSLCEGSSAAVAASLRDAAVPFVFLTGFAGTEALPAAFRDAPILTKPCDPQELIETLMRIRRTDVSRGHDG